MAKRKRDYKKEYAEYHGKPEQRKRRSQRVLARRDAEKRGLVKKGDGKEVDHVDMNRKGSLNNRRVRVISRAKNRKKQPKRDGSQD